MSSVSGGSRCARPTRTASRFPSGYSARWGRRWDFRKARRWSRPQTGGRPLRTLYAFNPLRTAILLLGGDKGGEDRWYQKFVPVADRLYEEHLKELEGEGRI